MCAISAGEETLTEGNVGVMCRVKRGQDWNKEDQDGGVGNLGTVLGYKIADGSVFAPDSVAKVTAVSACVLSAAPHCTFARRRRPRSPRSAPSSNGTARPE